MHRLPARRHPRWSHRHGPEPAFCSLVLTSDPADIRREVRNQLLDTSEFVGFLTRAIMPMIALAAFVVVKDHALSRAAVKAGVFEPMPARRNRLRHLPN